jgi:hypothetical protein
MNKNISVDSKNISKILMIYNAILNGWAVKLKKKEKNQEIFEFSKKKQKIEQNLDLNGYLKELFD